MRAENLLLTHFSARYPKMPPQITSKSSDNNGSGSPREGRRVPNIGLAFDLSRIRLGDMKKLSAYVDAMKQCVDETTNEEGDDEEMEAQDAGLVADHKD